MDKCLHCSGKVKERDQALCCDNCDVWCHYICIQGEKLSFPMLQAKKHFYCSTECKEKLSPRLEKIIESLKSSVDDLIKNVEHHNALYDELNKQVDDMKVNIENLRNTEVAELKSNNMLLSGQINSLKADLNVVMQERLSKNVICFGVKYVAHEKTTEKVVDLLKSHNIQHNGIVHCRRTKINNNSGPNSSPAIIITFDGQVSRNDFLNIVKKKKIQLDVHMSTTAQASSQATGSQQDVTTKKSYIAFRELLTEDNKKLLYAARSALKSSYRFIWVKNGNTYARKATGDKDFFWVKNEMDIQRLLESA